MKRPKAARHTVIAGTDFLGSNLQLAGKRPQRARRTVKATTQNKQIGDKEDNA